MGGVSNDNEQEKAVTDEGKLAKVLRRVRALQEQADHPNTAPAEAETYRTKADALMFQYKIDSLTVQSADGQSGVPSLAPVWSDVPLVRVNSEFYSHYSSMIGSILYHVGARGVTSTKVGEDGVNRFVCHMVGFQSDIEYAQILFLSAAQEFGRKLEPKYDARLSDQLNAYFMREAGMEGWRIAMAIWGSDAKPLRVKARNLHRKECEARGENSDALSGRGVNVKQFRTSYADGFVTSLNSRLWRLRQARGADSGGLVLASATESVDEALYARYPRLRPTDEVVEYKDPRKNCEKCQKAKSGYCREHQWMKPSEASRKDNTNWHAYERGEEAARRVDLGPGGKGRVEGGSGPSALTG